MNTLHDFVMLEYSLIISIAGTIFGLIVAIVGVVCSRKATMVVGIVLLIIFLLLCGVILNDKYLSETSNNSVPAASSGGTAGLANAGEASPKPIATSKPVEASPKPTATPKPIEASPKPTATPKPIEVSPAAPTTTPTAKPQSDNAIAASAPAAAPADELALDIAPITASLYNVLPITLLDSSISSVEIETLPGNISSLQQADNYSFVPEVDGTYRFEFSDVPSGTYYSLYIFNSGNERLKYNTNLDNGDGITISLVAGQSYNIQVSQYKNTGAYTLNIGPQKPVVDISQLTVVNDSIQYTAQENNYLFVAPREGLYRFEFSNVPEGTDLSLYAYNAGWERIKYAQNLDNNDGISVSLSTDQAYYIRVMQYNHTGPYTLNIGQKKEIADISAYTAVSDSIQYTAQENDYAFTPSVSGTYRFEFSNVPDGTDLSLYAFNSGWERIKYAQNLDNGYGLSIPLSAGETYYIRVAQYNSVGDYTLNIGHKKEIADISSYTAVTDSIQYTAQENDYAFTPSVSGTYRFEFSNVPDGTDLSLYAFNSGWERIKYAQNLDNGYGISVELSAGKTYYIRVSQYNNCGTYKLCFFRQK